MHKLNFSSRFKTKVTRLRSQGAVKAQLCTSLLCPKNSILKCDTFFFCKNPEGGFENFALKKLLKFVLVYIYGAVPLLSTML